MQRSTPADISYTWVIGLIATLAIAILIGPVLIVIATSFTTSQTLRFPPPDVSIRWYRELFDPARSGPIHTAALNSVWVAGIATAIGSVLSVLAALAITRVSRPSAKALEASFLSPLVLPTLSYGLAALMFFSVLGVRPSLNLLIAGHLVVIAPFIFRTTLASLTQLDPALLEASANLGASRFYAFRRITLPLIAPGIAAGAFLAFISSMDNVPVSLFLSNARTSMLPIRMWGMMESTLDVRIAAIAGVLILATLILMVVMDRLTGLTKRMSA
ncbi:ABC transporter permease [Phreatobacter aquaticus]|uniref:ABC transporter permease n=1 Tax=Phreatobacter aquaticus TaxID=2570229 RepID=A0A4D7QRG6_9HYPH|nr:ABC transporter permease [Phreatobacter aquaticus]QCK87517.1 ABC transporter permease [Phreatobacter aquaticus]